jgi:hypothetical protein
MRPVSVCCFALHNTTREHMYSNCASYVGCHLDTVELLILPMQIQQCQRTPAHLALRRRAFRYTADVSSARSLIWTWTNMRAAKRYARPMSGLLGVGTPGGCT